MTSPTDPRRFLYRADALDPDLAQTLAREALAKADDGELYLQYRATESFGFEDGRSEEHTSELQSLMRISYAVFCSNKTNNNPPHLSQSTCTQNYNTKT